MEPIEGSETSAFKPQTPGKYPKENILHKEHGESLKRCVRNVKQYLIKIIFILSLYRNIRNSRKFIWICWFRYGIWSNEITVDHRCEWTQSMEDERQTHSQVRVRIYSVRQKKRRSTKKETDRATPIKIKQAWSGLRQKCTKSWATKYTGLFEMIFWVLTTCHTQYTWDRSICFFLFNRTTPEVFVTHLTGALYVHPLWFYKHQHNNRVRSKLFVACQRWWFEWRFWFVPSVPGYLREEDPWRNPTEINHMGLHLENEVAVVKTPTIISNNPVFYSWA